MALTIVRWPPCARECQEVRNYSGFLMGSESFRPTKKNLRSNRHLRAPLDDATAGEKNIALCCGRPPMDPISLIVSALSAGAGAARGGAAGAAGGGGGAGRRARI